MVNIKMTYIAGLAMILTISSCASPLSEKQKRVMDLREEIRVHVHTPCALSLAENMRTDPGNRFYDVQLEGVLNRMRYGSEFQRIRDDATSKSNDIVRVVYDTSDLETRKVAYEIYREVCIDTFMYQDK